MKILEINKFYYLRGGSERHMFELSEALARRGHSVISFSMIDKKNQPSLTAEYFFDEVPLDKFSLKNILKIFYNWQAARQLEKLIKAERPDIAHLHNIQYQLTPAIIQTLKKHGIPIIQTLHAYNIICPNARLYTKGSPCERCRPSYAPSFAKASDGKKASEGRRPKFYQCLANKCVHDSYAKSLLAMLEAYLNVSLLKRYDDVDLFIAPSKFMKEVSVRFGMPAEKIRVLHNFVDTEKYSNKKSVVGDYLLYFGRLSEEKGIDDLIEAIRNLPGVKLKIVGDGPDREKLKVKSAKLKVDNRVELLGHQADKELRHLIANAKAVVIPSLWPENMPYSLLEAMAMGKTVIAARIGGLPELIEDGKNGFLFNSGSAEALNQRLRILNRTDLTVIGLAARQSVMKLNCNNYCDEFEKIINNIKK